MISEQKVKDIVRDELSFIDPGSAIPFTEKKYSQSREYTAWIDKYHRLDIKFEEPHPQSMIQIVMKKGFLSDLIDNKNRYSSTLKDQLKVIGLEKAVDYPFNLQAMDIMKDTYKKTFEVSFQVWSESSKVMLAGREMTRLFKASNTLATVGEAFKKFVKEVKPDLLITHPAGEKRLRIYKVLLNRWLKKQPKYKMFESGDRFPVLCIVAK